MISEKLLSKLLSERIESIIADKDVLYEEYNFDEEETEDCFIATVKCGFIKLNKYKLAINIVDEIVLKQYVVHLTKVKDHWWCDFATENYYKNNGHTNRGSENNHFDTNTKSDDPLSAAVKAYEWILENSNPA